MSQLAELLAKQVASQQLWRDSLIERLGVSRHLEAGLGKMLADQTAISQNWLERLRIPLDAINSSRCNFLEQLGVNSHLKAVSGVCKLFADQAAIGHSITERLNHSLVADQAAISKSVLDKLNLGLGDLWKSIASIRTQLTDQAAWRKAFFDRLGITKQLELATRFSDTLSKLHPHLSDYPWLKRIDLGSLAEVADELEHTTVDGITGAEIEAIKNRLDAMSSQQGSLAAQIDYLFTAAKSKEERWLLRMVVVWMLLQFFATPLQDGYHFLRDYVADNVKPAEIIKRMRKLWGGGGSLSPAGEARNLRFVKRVSIKARSSYGTRSHHVAALGVGQCTFVLRKRKKFSFVEWFDPNLGTTMQGWVRTKYLSR